MKKLLLYLFAITSCFALTSCAESNPKCEGEICNCHAGCSCTQKPENCKCGSGCVCR